MINGEHYPAGTKENSYNRNIKGQKGHFYENSH